MDSRAVMDYLRQGGGWMLLHLAADHKNTWGDLYMVLGARSEYFNGTAQYADLVADSAAKRHPEIRHVLTGFPETLTLNERWISFEKTARPQPGVTVLYTARNGRPALMPPGDGSQDHPYVWAREVDRGRLLYNGLGHGGSDLGVPLTAQADSVVTRMFWMNLRWLAGDFRHGCTDPTSNRFDPEARIDDGNCFPRGSLKPARVSASSPIRLSGRHLQVDGKSAEGIRLFLRDLRGALLWRRSLPAGRKEIILDASLEPGVYHLEARFRDRTFHHRAVIH